MKTIKNRLENWRTTTIIKAMKFGLQKVKKGRKKPKLEIEEQRRRNCSLDLSPENVHQRKLKTQRN
jgi:hypothetical protein